jgi:NAD(P)-dependent dehydrogenase (short-subunit alcohol dehydrogenase family)
VARAPSATLGKKTNITADAYSLGFVEKLLGEIRCSALQVVRKWSVVLAFGETPERLKDPVDVLAVGAEFAPIKFQAYTRVSCALILALNAENKYVELSSPVDRIIMIGSESAFYGRTGLPFYSAENAAIHQFVFAIAPVFAELGVSVFGVSPGSVSTGGDSGVIPSKLVELAETIVWLATDAPATLSGSTLRLSAD